MITEPRRETRYTRAVRLALAQLGHATNAQLTAMVRREFPLVSDTTIHRVTQRFYDDGVVAEGPKSADGAIRYDYNNDPHDHFMCDNCGRIQDINIPGSVRSDIECGLGGCCLTGNLTIVGRCKKCKEIL